MPILADILQWSGAQSVWVQDALRRVFVSNELTNADYDELMLLLLNAHGVTSEQLPVAQPLKEEHLPAIPMSGVVCLSAISEMECVNRFPSGSSIKFAPTGLTIVFGQNGAGKSGIARVLKQVCRARTRKKVLGNAFAEDFERQIPAARIHYQLDGVDKDFVWSMESPSPTELQSIAILDDFCAQDYVANEGDAAFQPFGLGHLELLASKVFAELHRRVERASNELSCDVVPFSKLVAPTTAAGRLLSRISADTDSIEVERLGSVSDAERARMTELTALLSELNLEPKAQALEAFAARLEAISEQANSAKSFVEERSVNKWRELLETSDAASKARDDVEALLRGDNLPGTGGEIWRQMFIAAKQYSLQDAYPNQDAPFIGIDAKCVLCQSALDQAARDKLTAFNNFVVSGAAVAAKTAEENVKSASTKISEADLALTIDEVLHGEIATDAPEILVAIDLARNEFSARRSWMMKQFESRDWQELPSMTLEPGCLSMILAKVMSLRKRAAVHREAMDQKVRAALEAEKVELDARLVLAPHKDALLAVISNLKRKALLQGCLRSLDTTFISRQCGTLATRYITDALVTSMTAELQQLKVGRVSHNLRKRIYRGRTMISMVLEGTNAKADEILSEGEKRMTAIAFFLAELAQSGSLSGILADDPVSSLDHKYRQRVGSRLVRESLQRQVVILTHDAVFLAALLTECEKLSIMPEVLTIGWAENAPGNVQRGLPWMNQSIGEKLALLDEDQKRLHAAWGEEPSEECCRDMADVYGRVRGTLERIVRESVLNKAVRPFDDRVQIERVAAVAGFSIEEFGYINKVYLRCNSATDAHDSSAEGAKALPHPTDLAEDLAVMRSIIDASKARQRARDKEVKALAEATGRE